MKSIKKKAQSLVEYGLILALVAVIAIAALQFLGKRVNDAATQAGDDIKNVGKNAAQTYCGAIQGSWNNGVCTMDNNNNNNNNQQ